MVQKVSFHSETEWNVTLIDKFNEKMDDYLLGINTIMQRLSSTVQLAIKHHRIRSLGQC